MNKTKLLVKVSNGLFLMKTGLNQEGNWRSDHFYKLIYSLNGPITYKTKWNQLSLSDQQFVLFNPFDEHKQLFLDKNKFLIEIEPSFLNHFANSLTSSNHFDIQFASCIQQSSNLTNWVQLVTEYIQLEKDIQTDSMKIFLEHSLSQLVLILLKDAIGSQIYDLNINNYKTVHPQIYKVMQKMKESYQYPWSLDDMANISELNKFQFSHYFKEIVGISPYSWLQIYRVIRSQEMLTTTNKTILNISLECGFSSVNIYNQLFKRLYGITPSYFRKIRQ